jgi:hypothetical protein
MLINNNLILDETYFKHTECTVADLETGDLLLNHEY